MSECPGCQGSLDQDTVRVVVVEPAVTTGHPPVLVDGGAAVATNATAFGMHAVRIMPNDKQVLVDLVAGWDAAHYATPLITRWLHQLLPGCPTCRASHQRICEPARSRKEVRSHDGSSSPRNIATDSSVRGDVGSDGREAASVDGPVGLAPHGRALPAQEADQHRAFVTGAGRDNAFHEQQRGTRVGATAATRLPPVDRPYSSGAPAWGR